MSPPSALARLWAVALLLLLLLVLALLPRAARAHEYRPAVLTITAVEGEGATAGSYQVNFAPPFDAGRREILAVRPVFPEGCEYAAPTLTCADGLRGTLGVEGLTGQPVDVVVRIEHGPDRVESAVLRASAPQMTVRGDGGGVVWEYLSLGVVHILGGIDHLLFVFGLLLLVGFGRQLLWTVTGFTLAHSVTLALSAMDLVRPQQGPVEAVIALSIVLVAVEVAGERDDRAPSLSHRWPVLVSSSFGLLHGFGFSGALREIGFPTGQLAVPLLSFNLGVEVGQLAVLGALWLMWRGVRERERFDTLAPRLRVGAAYAVGALATFWTVDRVVALWQ